VSPIARLAREFEVNWRTARRYATSEVPPGYGPRECPAGLTEAQLAHVLRRLDLCPDLRATTLLREVRDLGYAGSYPSFARRVRILRPEREDVDPPLRFETDPVVQAQGDWAHCGRWLLGGELLELHALVAVLGYSRMVAVRFATDTTRATTLELLPRVLDDLGGVTGEVLTDRDPAFVIGQTPGRRPVFAPQWVDLAAVLGLTPKACRPYRAQTKGKVERVIRELKEDFLRWLTGQPLPPRPGLADYDGLVLRWCREVVAARRHRTTGRIVAEAWAEERQHLRTIPRRLVAARSGTTSAAPVIDLAAARRAGDEVQARSLSEYEVHHGLDDAAQQPEHLGEPSRVRPQVEHD
jgi:transposase